MSAGRILDPEQMRRRLRDEGVDAALITPT